MPKRTILTHLKETYREQGVPMKIMFWFIPAAILILLAASIVILATTGFDEQTVAAPILLLMILIVFGSAALIGNTVKKAEMAGRKPPVGRCILAFFGAVCLFMVPIIYIQPNKKADPSGDLIVALLMLGWGILLNLPILFYRIHNKTNRGGDL